MYIDILDKNLWPVVVWYFEGKEYLFMDDNAPVHRAHTVENYKDPYEATSMEWPAQSPDLNIIAELSHAKRACSGAPWVRKFGKLSIQENLVMT